MCLCCMYHVIFQESEADIRVFYVLHMSNEQVFFLFTHNQFCNDFGS